MTRLQEKRRAFCREIMEFYCQYEDRYWEVLDTLSVDKIDGHDAADQFLSHYARKLREVMDLMSEYYACFREEDDEDIQ